MHELVVDVAAVGEEGRDGGGGGATRFSEEGKGCSVGMGTFEAALLVFVGWIG